MLTQQLGQAGHCLVYNWWHNYLTILRVFKFKGLPDKGGGGGWGLRAKICHGSRATLIRPWSLSVVLVVLMPIAKDRKRAPITPPVSELLAQPRPAQWNMGAQGKLYLWSPSEPQLSPSPLSTIFLSPYKFVFARPPWAGGVGNIAPYAPLPDGRPWRHPCLIITIYFK
jgi:hypothetical protein